jgi:hypothetical protein
MSPGVRQLFATSDWAGHLLEMFGDQDLWRWRGVSSESQLTLGTRSEIQSLLKRTRPEAASDESINAILSLNLRRFDESDPYPGSLDWWRDAEPYMNLRPPGVRPLYQAVQRAMSRAGSLGLRLLIDRISISLNRSTTSKPVGLSPVVHTDADYGPFEASICSIQEAGYPPWSSTLFFPTLDMQTLDALKPVTSGRVLSFSDTDPAVYASPGDIAIFSGKKTNDGRVLPNAGLPHVSPEGFFPTARLTLLLKMQGMV